MQLAASLGAILRQGRPAGAGVLVMTCGMLLAGERAAWGAPLPHEPAPVAVSWRELQPGLEYACVAMPGKADIGDGRLHVVRVDPAVAKLGAFLALEQATGSRTASRWCKERRLAAAINLGMFQPSLANVGYARHAGRVNNPAWNGYRSALAFDGSEPGLPAVRWADLDAPPGAPGLVGYGTVIQNLRLIRSPGSGVWAPARKRWSEAAVAIDTHARILFLFCRSPYPMHEFCRGVLALPLHLVQAMHVEGGPEASLSVHAGGVDLDLCGSYETGFREDDANDSQWPIPNVLGVARADRP